MSQNELSKQSGVSQSTINRYLSGDVMPTLKNVLLICKALDCSVEDIITI